MKKYTIIFLALFFVYSIGAENSAVVEEVEDDDDESISDDVSFENFVNKYSKKYDDEEHKNKRKIIYAKNRKMINEHKSNYKKGRVGYNLRINEFADYTNDEFNQRLTGSLKNRPRRNVTEGSANSRVRRDVPAAVDYVKMGAVTVAQNQGNCGSCYSFAAVAAVESHLFLKIGLLYKLSEQQAVDCSLDYNYGCDGGWSDAVYQYFIDAGYVAALSVYPYKSGSTGTYGTCFEPAQKSKAKVTSYGYVGYGEAMLHTDLANIGPISVSINASLDSFHYYGSGIYSDLKCSSGSTNHAVVVVAYSTNSQNITYWLIKNSWGTSWGNTGYGKMMNGSNICGIANYGDYPILSLP